MNNPSLWLVVAVLAVVTPVAFSPRWRRFRQNVPDEMLPLLSAAQSALRTAERDRLALVVVARRDGGDPAQWFARSIPTIVPVYARNQSGGFDRTDDGGAQSLYIRKQDLTAYMRWARSVQ